MNHVEQRIIHIRLLNAPALASYADFSQHLPRDSFTGAYTKGFDTVRRLLAEGWHCAACNLPAVGLRLDTAENA